MTKAYCYLLRCCDSTLYVGSTKNLSVRVKEHQDGEGANYTKRRLPVELVYWEVFDRIDFAFDREHQIKKWSHGKKEALIEKEHKRLHELSKKKFKRN